MIKTDFLHLRFIYCSRALKHEQSIDSLRSLLVISPYTFLWRHIFVVQGAMYDSQFYIV